MKLGKCEVWILSNAPGPKEKPRFIDYGYEGNVSSSAQVQGQVMRRTKRRLQSLGLIECVRERFPRTQADEDELENRYGCHERGGCNHTFWANYVRLTPKGELTKRKVMEASITSYDKNRGHE